MDLLWRAANLFNWHPWRALGVSLLYVRVLPFEQIGQAKGLEFQHVFIFIKRGLYDELQSGFSGTGRDVYHERRLLRIPFTRAKDSLVTFVLD